MPGQDESPKNLIAAGKEMIASSKFQGAAAVAGLVAAIVNDNPWIRLSAILVIFWAVYSLRSYIRSGTRKTLTWLTWKFALGLLVGALVTFSLVPLLDPVYRGTMALVMPQVEVVNTVPVDGGELMFSHSAIEVTFSQRIPRFYRNPWFINVELTPDVPTNRTWLYWSDPSDCCGILSIGSDRYYPGNEFATFEPNKTYHVRIDGLLLKQPKELTFRTPPD